MSCFGCSRRYSFFCKEYGCPNCGYSFCGKCLKRPIEVPRHNNQILNVCLMCYDKLCKIQMKEKVVDVDVLPENYLTQSKINKQNQNAPNQLDINVLLKVDTSTVLLDDVLVPITEKSVNTASTNNTKLDVNQNLDTVIMKRLKNLQGVDFSSEDRLCDSLTSGVKETILLSTDQRSDQEKVDDLLKQFIEETRLDNQLQTERNTDISDIERRLRALRDTSFNPNVAPSYAEESNQKILSSENLSDFKDNSKSITEELPWCIICNDDAQCRCNECNGELFCFSCFRDLHEYDTEYHEHVKTDIKTTIFSEDHFT